MASIFVTWGVTSTGLELSTDSMYISGDHKLRSGTRVARPP